MYTREDKVRAVELLGKGPSADPTALTTREKTILMESLRPAHKLKDLLDAVGLSQRALCCGPSSPSFRGRCSDSGPMWPIKKTAS